MNVWIDMSFSNSGFSLIVILRFLSHIFITTLEPLLNNSLYISWTFFCVTFPVSFLYLYLDKDLQTQSTKMRIQEWFSIDIIKWQDDHTAFIWTEIKIRDDRFCTWNDVKVGKHHAIGLTGAPRCIYDCRKILINAWDTRPVFWKIPR